MTDLQTDLQDIRNLLILHSQDFARVNQQMEAMHKVSCDRLAILDDENRKLRAEIEALKVRLDELAYKAYENGEDHL